MKIQTKREKTKDWLTQLERLGVHLSFAGGWRQLSLVLTWPQQSSVPSPSRPSHWVGVGEQQLLESTGTACCTNPFTGTVNTHTDFSKRDEGFLVSPPVLPHLT